MEEDRGKKKALLFSILQFMLVVAGTALAGVTSVSESTTLGYISIGLLVSCIALNIPRRFLGLNLFAVPKESKYQTFMLLCQLSGLSGIVAVRYGFFISGISLVLFSIAFQYCTRYELWSLFEDAKSIESNKLRLHIITFSGFFALAIIINPIAGVAYKLIIAWLFASFVLGIKSIRPVKEKMIQGINKDSQKIRSKFLVLVLKIFSFGTLSTNFNQSLAIRIFGAIATSIAAPVVGSFLAPYYFYLYIMVRSPKKAVVE